MKLMSRMLNSFLVLIALLLTCASLTTGWLFEPGVWSDSFSNYIRLLEAQRKGEQLERETQSTRKRLQAKVRVAEALKNGEMTLIDAAACFCALHTDPRSWHHPQRPRPERTDGEGWCREVIEWTERYTRHDHSSSQVDALRQRLEAELQEQLECYGTVTLPE
jgi:hypothetical protein